jgi:hypothetical protein
MWRKTLYWPDTPTPDAATDARTWTCPSLDS